ncbi:MAG: cation-translocating P-type ATPase [Microcoleaceae cyanobacterium]
MASSSSNSSSPSSSATALTKQTWHDLSIEQVCQRLRVDPNKGLAPEQVQQRRERYGRNEIETDSVRQPLEIIWEQFADIMLMMLIAVAIISAILDFKNGDFPKDAVAIFAIVLLNALLGYFQESRAEKALAALRQLSAPSVQVLRSNAQSPQSPQIAEIDSGELVPGDVILLEAGQQISADGRLIAAQNLRVREATLTGEAEAVVKQADLVSEDADLSEQKNMVFQGTEVLQGRGKAVITDTGMYTELGRIAAMLQGVETEPTPLQQRMEQLGTVLVIGSLILVVLVIVGGIIKTGGFQYLEELVEVSLSMAVAVVPEGLAAVVTVTLAIGTQRMVRRNALIRKLPAVETLGSVTVICSDKTGTLTQNKMVVQQIAQNHQHFTVTGAGYEPWGKIQQSIDGKTVDGKTETVEAVEAAQLQNLQPLFLSAALCNDAELKSENDHWSILGDPTEGALLALAGKAGIFKSTWGEQLPRIAELPFTSERKRMTVVCQQVQGNKDEKELNLPHAPFLSFTKGSPELVLEHCTSRWQDGQPLPLDQNLHQQILEQNDQMAMEGLRVIGLACKPLSQKPEITETELEQDLIWLGLVAMLDASRPEVKQAVEECQTAGIRPIMITGDHQLTAAAIAQHLCITRPGDPVLTGQQIQQLSPAEFEHQVKAVNVYARVTPEHKLRIVQTLQRQGEFVAMTGDGVNDAPALKQADIGIALGLMGTDVSKEASDMILLDDNFATFVAAAAEGRVVYSNIRRFVKYILGSNIGEVLVIAAAPIIGLGGSPLTPLQILWMNLVTDGLPALALALEPAEPDIMNAPPISPQESIFARGLGAYMIRIGLIFAILTIVMMVIAHEIAETSGNPERWKTMVFTTLCLAQMGHAIAVRSETQLTLRLNPLSNPYLLAAVSVTTILQLMLIYVAPLRNFFGTQILSPSDLAICIGFSTLVFVWIEMEKFAKKFTLNQRKH